jgi:hemerythrin-like domain-containing protein
MFLRPDAPARHAGWNRTTAGTVQRATGNVGDANQGAARRVPRDRVNLPSGTAARAAALADPPAASRGGRSRTRGRRGVDLYSLLKRDHQRILALIEELEDSDDNDARAQLFTQLRAEMAVHKEAEERTLYAALSILPEISDMIEEAMEEHVDMEELIEELDGLSPDDPDFAAQVSELREEIDHHFTEEETEIFARAKEVLTADQASKVAEEFEAEKGKLAAA